VLLLKTASPLASRSSTITNRRNQLWRRAVISVSIGISDWPASSARLTWLTGHHWPLVSRQWTLSWSSSGASSTDKVGVNGIQTGASASHPVDRHRGCSGWEERTGTPFHDPPFLQFDVSRPKRALFTGKTHASRPKMKVLSMGTEIFQWIIVNLLVKITAWLKIQGARCKIEMRPQIFTGGPWTFTVPTTVP